MTRAHIRLATRGSPLALAQAAIAAEALRAHHPGAIDTQVVTVTTRGDRTQAFGGHLSELARQEPGLFVSEVEAALLAGKADVAVHSYKDMPTSLTPRTAVVAVLPRSRSADILVLDREAGTGGADGDGLQRLQALAPGTCVGTSSPRRAALLGHHAPHVVAGALRGNVGTRLAQCRDGNPPAVILAAAGVDRLGDAGPDPLAGMSAVALAPNRWHPAPAQGALALQVATDSRFADTVAAVDHRPTRLAVELERACLAALGGGCALAVGAWAEPLDGASWRLHFGYSLEGQWHRRVAQGGHQRLQRELVGWAGGGDPPGEQLD